MATLCDETRGLLASGAAPGPSLSAHVAGCERCRGALVAILAAHSPTPAAYPTCADMDDLPAYLDAERAEGEAAAAARYPQIWWHLWVCPGCAEEARLTAALRDAELAGTLGGLPAPARAWPALRLARSFLHDLFAPQAALGAAWAIEEPAALIAEESDGTYRVALLARPVASGDWSLSVVATPPVPAIAVLRFGPQVYRAPFDASGTATVDAVPARLLTRGDGPPLEVTLEPLAGSQGRDHS